jgi:hypothetical protein
MRCFPDVRAHLRASRFVFDAWGPCSVVELAFAGLDVGAAPGDTTGGQCAGELAGGALLTGAPPLSLGTLGGASGVGGPGGAR